MYYFFGQPTKLYYFGEFMAELRKRSKVHLGWMEFAELKKTKRPK